MSMQSVNVGCWCKYCNSGDLCGDVFCDICINKSFAISDKSMFWNFEKNKDTPIDIRYGSEAVRWFNCKTCSHTFDIKICKITRPEASWCPYCSSHRLCSDNNCKICYERSFASNPLSKFWSNKNTVSPREMMFNSGKKFIFECECGEELEYSLDYLSRGNWGCSCEKILPHLEQEMEKVLKQYDIKFERQISYDDCRNKLPLIFDYRISIDAQTTIIIELQGEQHFRYCAKFHKTEGRFETQQHIDYLKVKYVTDKKHHYFVAISYRCQNYIDQILDIILKNPKNNYFFIRQTHHLNNCKTFTNKEDIIIRDRYEEILDLCAE